MAIMTTASGPTNSIRTLYSDMYMDEAERVRLYDQFAVPVEQAGVEQAAKLGATCRVNFLQALPISTDTISQTADVTPQTMIDAYAEVTATSRGAAVQWSELLDLEVYTNLGEARYRAVGRQMMESVDAVAIQPALAGDLVVRYTVRSSLSAASSDHYFNEKQLNYAEQWLQQLQCPAFKMNGRPQWVALGNSAIFKDLRESGNIVSVGIYQDKEIILNYELGQIGPWKLVMSPDAHIFIGQGAAPTSAVATTLSSSAAPLAKTLVVGSSDNLGFKQWLNIIDAAESGSTCYFNNERVKYVSSATGTMAFIGMASNGGLRYGHASGVSVTNNYSVYPVVFGGPVSLACMYADNVGRFGQLVGPHIKGSLEQFQEIGWKWYGGYGRWKENGIVRGEFAASFDNQ